MDFSSTPRNTCPSIEKIKISIDQLNLFPYYADNNLTTLYYLDYCESRARLKGMIAILRNKIKLLCLLLFVNTRRMCIRWRWIVAK